MTFSIASLLLPALLSGLLAPVGFAADPAAPAAPVLSAALADPDPVADEPVDLAMVSAIREEGLENSQVMDFVWQITDVHGPRLTNSPRQRAAAVWARDAMTAMGMGNAVLEPWGEFGLGWSFSKCVVEMTVPDYAPLIAIPKAWTRGLEHPVRGAPVLVVVESEADFEQYRGQLAGRIVLNGELRDVKAFWEPLAQRHDDETLADLEKANEPGVPDAFVKRSNDWEARRELRKMKAAFFDEEGVAVVIEPDAGRRNDYGVIMLGAGGSYDPEEPRALPQVTLAAEHWNRIARLLVKEVPVEVAVDVRATFHADDLQGHNIVAEIPGSDPELRDEVVMLGAHFDSWHPATGATDNGASCAVMMEAARILLAVDARPRRTVRVVLWTGEEQGLLGSKGYVKNHFADRDTMALLPEHERLAAYFNMDNGGGKLRGVYMQGNAGVRSIFEAWLAPFEDLGATTLTMRDTGGTDHLSFDAVGLPGFQFIQDRLDYGSRTHHTNMDTYERIVPGDVMQAATIIASFAYHAAMRDEMLPRKPLPKPKEKEGGE